MSCDKCVHLFGCLRSNVLCKLRYRTFSSCPKFHVSPSKSIAPTVPQAVGFPVLTYFTDLDLFAYCIKITCFLSGFVLLAGSLVFVTHPPCSVQEEQSSLLLTNSSPYEHNTIHFSSAFLEDMWFLYSSGGIMNRTAVSIPVQSLFLWT